MLKTKFLKKKKKKKKNHPYGIVAVTYLLNIILFYWSNAVITIFYNQVNY